MRLALALALALGLRPPHARAQDAAAGALPRVRVIPSTCPGAVFPLEPFVAALRVEVGASVEADGAGADPDALVSVEPVGCAPGAPEVTVTLTARATGERVRRAIDLGDLPVATRPRVVAIAVAELLRASWHALAAPRAAAVEAPEIRVEATPAPPVTVVPPLFVTMPRVRVVRARRRRPAPLAPERAGITLSFDSRLYTERPQPASGLVVPITGLNGVRAELSVPMFGVRGWRILLDAAALFGGASPTVGATDLGALVGGVGVGATAGSEALRVDVGARVEAGYGWAAGRAQRGADVTGVTVGAPVLSVSIPLALRARFAPRLWATVQPELGITLIGYEPQVLFPNGTTSSLARVGGPFGALQLGLTWGP